MISMRCHFLSSGIQQISNTVINWCDLHATLRARRKKAEDAKDSEINGNDIDVETESSEGLV